MVAMEQQQEHPVTALLIKYLAAKAAETMAIETRVEIGNQIAKELGAPDEGSKTHNVDGWSVKLTTPMNRKVDWGAFDRALQGHKDWPEKTKRELDVAGLRWWQENKPDVYLELSKAITATPGRVSVEVKQEK